MERANTITGHLFCVFSAPQPDVSRAPADAIYLRRRADARVLATLLGHLYESNGIGITTSDDEVVPPTALPALEAAISSAIVQVEAQPATWPVLLGYRDQELRDAIVEPASRQIL